MEQKKKIAISGASGFIGSYLTLQFEQMGYEVFSISRKVLNDQQELKDILSQVQIVINLAGAPINRLWTKSYKRELIESRIITTRKIVSTINQLLHKPQLLISTSAIGYYSTKACYDEYTSEEGTGFLPSLCQAWEDEAKQVDSAVRLVIARLGVVLSHRGGAFEQMIASTKIKLATVLGDSQHLLSWISLVDVLGAINHIMQHPQITGAINLVSPQNISNHDLLKAIKKHYKSYFGIRIPSAIIRLLVGDTASFLIDSPCAYPKCLTDSSFEYKHPSFVNFLEDKSGLISK